MTKKNNKRLQKKKKELSLKLTYIGLTTGPNIRRLIITCVTRVIATLRINKYIVKNKNKTKQN